MDEMQRAAMLIAQASAALIEAMGMHAENQNRISNSHSIAYDEGAFQDVINRYGIGHNSAVSLLTGRS